MRRLPAPTSALFALVVAQAFTLAAANSSPAAAQDGAKSKPPSRPAFTSVYTDMKRDCKSVPDAEAEAHGSDPPAVCKGFGGYQLSVGYSAWGASIAARLIKKPDEHVLLGQDYGNYGERGEKAEWRLAGGKPFAVIIRFGKYGEPGDDGNPFAKRTGSTLVVKGLKGWGHIDFEVDGSAADANEKARRMADENYSRR